ncbi:MAG: DEAD/DEAH box helicase family protein [Oscillospiraceae bacterium]|nr:DEAD/DEAH box helicase family protein [Oscillospiraceae bacterium]
MKTTNFALIENEFNAAIKSGDVTDDIINDILDEFLFFCDENQYDAPMEFLLKMQSHSKKQGCLYYWISAYIRFIQNDLYGYLSLIEEHIVKIIEKYGKINSQRAFESYLSVILSKANDRRFLKKFHGILKRQCPDSAFERYMRYLCAETENKNILKKYLYEVTAIDDKWLDAYTGLGDIYSSEKNWMEAIKNYDKATEIEEPWAELFFALAWCYDKLQNYEKAIDYYELCLELAPEYRCTKNNLRVLKELKKMSSAVVDIDKKLKNTTENQNAGTIPVVQNNSGLQLYAHQQDAMRDMSRKILNKDDYAGLLVLPTGGGKTLTATYWLMGNILDSGQKIIWLAHRHELLNQARLAFEKVSFSDVARRKKQYDFRVISGQHDKPVHIKPTDDIIIASKTSLSKGFTHLSEKWLKDNTNDVFLVIDEAHHATAKEYRELINKIRVEVPSVKVLGLTATPFRTADNEQGLLKKIFYDDIVYKIDLRELINRGILAEPIFEEAETHVDMEALFKSADAEVVLERIANDSFFDIDTIGESLATEIAENKERNNAIVRKYTENKEKYGKTLVFALNVSMAIALNAVFREHGVKSEFIVSSIKDKMTGVTLSDKRNPEVIEQFRNGDLEVLINVNILTEGTDLPKVQTVFLTRPTKSTILMTQMIGRALRGVKAGGTKEAYIVSFVDDWHNRIAWVNPEQLFIDENVDFNDLSRETRESAVRLVAISKIEEFAKIADGTLEKSVSRLNFIERIPVGIYKFSYLVPTEDDEDMTINCDVLVYDCMQEAYKTLFSWLPTTDLRNVKSATQHINDILFAEIDRLIGYRKKDIEDIISYYKQTEELPEFIAFTERDDYDVKKLAQRIISKPANEIQIMNDEWDSNNSRWKAFFGINNFTAFRMSIRHEKDKLQFPEGYKPTNLKPITQHEQRQIQDLPLYEIRQKFPELGEKIRQSIFDKFTDKEGFYYSASGNYRSKNKLDFQIDHITPMSKGGKTTPNNLQLLTRAENMAKSDGLNR